MATEKVTATAGDMLDALRVAGVLPEDQARDLMASHGGIDLTVEAEIDDDDLVDSASTRVLRAELYSRWDYEAPDAPELEPFAEALTYARQGKCGLAGVMAARAFGPDVDLTPIEQALFS